MGDFITITDPVAGEYSISVSVNGETVETYYTLGILEIPALGTVPDITVSDVVYSNQRETNFQIRIFETGNQHDIDHLTFSISDLVDEEGNTISRDVVAFAERMRPNCRITYRQAVGLL